MTFEICIPIYSQNVLRRRWKHPQAYRRLRNDYTWLVRVGARSAGVPKATGKRRLHVTRLIGKGGKVYDVPNLIGGAKPLIDALVTEGLLVDDSPEYLDLGTWEQRKASAPGARITLEDV